MGPSAPERRGAAASCPARSGGRWPRWHPGSCSSPRHSPSGCRRRDKNAGPPGDAIAAGATHLVLGRPIMRPRREPTRPTPSSRRSPPRWAIRSGGLRRLHPRPRPLLPCRRDDVRRRASRCRYAGGASARPSQTPGARLRGAPHPAGSDDVARAPGIRAAPAPGRGWSPICPTTAALRRLRADLDCLPMEETLDIRIDRFTRGGPKCGHDGHTATLLGVATLLARRRDATPGNVRLIFQPAEEVDGGSRSDDRGGRPRGRR